MMTLNAYLRPRAFSLAAFAAAFALALNCFAIDNYSYRSYFGVASASLSPPATLVPGSNMDDVVVYVAAPFAFRIYSTRITAGTNIGLSTNGTAQLVSTGASTGSINGMLPTGGSSPFPVASPTIFPFWDDLNLATGGIYSAVYGSAPSREWELRWVGRHAFDPTGPDIVFSLVLYENGSHFEIRYFGTSVLANATAGIQESRTGRFSTVSGSPSLGNLTSQGPITLRFSLPPCSTDIDGDGQTLATTDGLLSVRAALGLTGTAVTANATNGVVRNTWPDIRHYLIGSCNMNLGP